MKSIKQISQLSEYELRGIINGDPETLDRMISQTLLSSDLTLAAESYAKSFGSRLAQAYQVMIEQTISEEFFSMLEEAAEDGQNTSRNGYYRRKVRTCLGDLDIQIPRARFLAFTTKLLKKYGHDLDDLSSRVMSLYRGGMSERDIVRTLSETEGTSVSTATIQRIVSQTVGEAAKFNSESVEDCPFVYMDATYVPFKRTGEKATTVEKEGILIAVGITPSGFRKVLGYAFGETEKINLWKDLLRMYPDLSPKEREDAICKKYGAVFVEGIGGKLSNGKKHDGRAPDYDDWSTVAENGKKGLNGDILIWYPVLGRSFELSSMGIRVDKESLLRQLEIEEKQDREKLYFHKQLLEDKLPL